MINQIKNLPLAQENPYPLHVHLGFVLTDWKDDFCYLELPLEPFSMKRFGIPHGGVQAVLLDTVMGYAPCFIGDANAQRYTVTIDLNVSFLAQSKVKIFFAEGRRIDGGRQIFLVKDRSRKIQGIGRDRNRDISLSIRRRSKGKDLK